MKNRLSVAHRGVKFLNYRKRPPGRVPTPVFLESEPFANKTHGVVRAPPRGQPRHHLETQSPCSRPRWRPGRSVTRTGRPVVDGTALELALLHALTCRCAINLQMSLDWSDMTKGSMLGTNGVAAAVARGLAGVVESAQHQERHPQPRGKREHQLLSELPRRRLMAGPWWLFEVSENRGYREEWARRPFFWLSRQRSAQEPRHLHSKVPIYGATEWASSTIRPAIAGVAS